MSKIFFARDLASAVASVISSSYHYGKVGVFGVDESIVDELIKAGNTIYYITTTEKIPLDARYIIVSGCALSLNYIRQVAKDRIVVVVADTINMTIVHNIAILGNQTIKCTPPKYIFYHNDSAMQQRYDCKKIIFGLYAEVTDILAGSIIYDNELVALMSSLEAALASECGVDELIKLAHLSGAVIEKSGALSVIGVGELVNAIYQNSVVDNYFLYYLGLLVLLQFTKYEFSGIFVGADRGAIRSMIGAKLGSAPQTSGAQLSIKDVTHIKNLLPSREELYLCILQCTTAEEKERTCAKFTDFALNNLLIASEIGEFNGLIAKPCTKRFIEELKNDNQN